MSTTAAAHERELADHRAANLRARQVITSLNLAAPQAEAVAGTIDIDTIRADLATCSRGNAYEQWMAQEDLKDKAEQYIQRLLNEIDSLITMIRDLDDHTTRDDPAHDTEFEAAQHKVSYLERALNNEMTARTLVLQRVARSVRNAYQKGYNAGRQQANH
ncbi:MULTISPECIES: hypothetical protein [Actinomyces]|uniref:Uncharacterized protein n=1 Tax=Actinomyces oris TaxID=544580 RepID=A0A1Q8VIM3_9ACTO|nr:hypothetical protein [Actinomyces oris]OLO47943.1 hypothetical protein BKH28_10785 [Actinomyces oris]